MNFKRKLNEELNNIVPEMSSEVKNAEFPSVVEVQKPEKTPFVFSFLKLATAVMAILITALAIYIPLRNNTNDNIQYNTNSVVLFDVNPSLKIVADENERIVSVSSANEDADVLIVEDGVLENIIGNTLNGGIEILIEKCVEYGYIDNSNSNAIKVTVANDNESKSKEISNNVKTKVEQFLKDKNIGAVFTVVNENIKNTAEKLGISYTSTDNFINELNSYKPLFFERRTEGFTESEFKNNYAQSFKTYAVETINGFYSLILSKINDLKSIKTDLNVIKEHNDNVMGLDYFILRELDNAHLGNDLIRLMKRVEDKIKAFNQKYQTDINDVIKFNAVYEIYINIDVDKLRVDITNIINSLNNNEVDVVSLITAFAIIIPDVDLQNLINNSFESFLEEPTPWEPLPSPPPAPIRPLPGPPFPAPQPRVAMRRSRASAT